MIIEITNKFKLTELLKNIKVSLYFIGFVPQ